MIPAWISFVKRCVACRSRVKIEAESPNSHRVRPLDRLVERREAVERRHGAEDLLARELGVVGEALEHGRRDQVAVVVGALAAREHGAALGRAPLDRGEDLLHRALVDDRPDLRLGVGRIADLAGRDAREQLLAERVVDGVLDEDAPRRRALLARRPERAGVRRLDRPVELGVGHHDQRVVSAELELDAAVARRRLVAHRVADRDRARERDRAHAGVRDELGADLRAGAGEDVQHARREAGLGEALGDVEPRPRRLVAELEDDACCRR